MLTYIGMQCMGKPSFDAVHEMDDDPDFYKAALGICCAIPSAETLRQRFDLIGSSMRRQILDENIRATGEKLFKQTAGRSGIISVR